MAEENRVKCFTCERWVKVSHTRPKLFYESEEPVCIRCAQQMAINDMKLEDEAKLYEQTFEQPEASTVDSGSGPPRDDGGDSEGGTPFFQPVREDSGEGADTGPPPVRRSGRHQGESSGKRPEGRNKRAEEDK